MRGVRSFMGRHQIPDFDSSSSSMDDNLFAGSQTQPTGKVSIKLPADDWLCWKLETLNLTIADGYPSRNTETAGLLRDQFVKTPRTSRWYDMYTDKKDASTSKVLHWSPDPSKLNSTFSRVVRHSLPSGPASGCINQDTLRCWERAAREQAYMCNQAACLSRCLIRVQGAMMTQLKTLDLNKRKGKLQGRSQQDVDEFDYLVTFNRSITKAMTRTMQDLSEGVFVNRCTCKLLCCKSCSFCQRVSTKERCIVSYCYHCQRIKCMKDVSCVDHLSSVNLVRNVPAVAPDLPVGARLHEFWEKWAALGAIPKVVTVLRERYTLLFWFRPNLTRSPTVISRNVNPQKNPLLDGGFASAGEQKCSRTASNSKIPGVYK